MASATGRTRRTRRPAPTGPSAGRRARSARATTTTRRGGRRGAPGPRGPSRGPWPRGGHGDAGPWCSTRPEAGQARPARPRCGPGWPRPPRRGLSRLGSVSGSEPLADRWALVLWSYRHAAPPHPHPSPAARRTILCRQGRGHEEKKKNQLNKSINLRKCISDIEKKCISYVVRNVATFVNSQSQVGGTQYMPHSRRCEITSCLCTRYVVSNQLSVESAREHAVSELLFLDVGVSRKTNTSPQSRIFSNRKRRTLPNQM